MIRVVALDNDTREPCIYDRSDGTVFLSDGEWVDLGDRVITHDFKMPKKGDVLVLRKEKEYCIDSEALGALSLNNKGERAALFDGEIDNCGSIFYNEYWYPLSWFNLDIEGKCVITETNLKEEKEYVEKATLIPVLPTVKELPLRGRKLLLTKYVK